MLINCCLGFYLNAFYMFVFFLFEKLVILHRSTGSFSMETMSLQWIVRALRYKYIYINRCILICVQLDLKVNKGEKWRSLWHVIRAYFSMKYSKNYRPEVSFKIMSHIWSFLFHKCILIYTLSTDSNLFIKLKFILLSFQAAQLHRYFSRITCE